LTSCFTEHKECDQSSQCTVREPLRRVHESILSLLDSISIADLLDEADQECAPAAEPALVQLGISS
jgi:DNA-binding IscR family transcriptional regulator